MSVCLCLCVCVCVCVVRGGAGGREGKGRGELGVGEVADGMEWRGAVTDHVMIRGAVRKP